MALWQLDIVGGVFLADGRELKMVSGIDDHSRYVVIAALVAVPTGRAVSEALLAALERYGVPGEVLTDNGKQFTGRYTRPAPVEEDLRQGAVLRTLRLRPCAFRLGRGACRWRG
jgi:transposase InsO family protein